MSATETTVLARARALHAAERTRGSWDALPPSEQRAYLDRAAAEPTPAPTPRALAVGLSDEDRAVLDLERRTWRHVGYKERALRVRLGMSLTRYTIRLNALIDRPEALEYAPAVVNRLRARRTSSLGPDELEGR